MNSKLHTACDGQGRPVALLLTEGQRSDRHGAALLRPVLPCARDLIGDRGYDSSLFRTALAERGINPGIPSTLSRKRPLLYDRMFDRPLHRIETMFGRFKDRRRVATRYDRCLRLGHLHRSRRHLPAAKTKSAELGPWHINHIPNGI
ncbi:transposase [Endosaccharibacter trunci]|uniref:transposase n=1 Tax=Endosaccharibacter trunci TaxID=2812733 RepID=UPI003BF4A4A1